MELFSKTVLFFSISTFFGIEYNVLLGAIDTFSFNSLSNDFLESKIIADYIPANSLVKKLQKTHAPSEMVKMMRTGLRPK